MVNDENNNNNEPTKEEQTTVVSIGKHSSRNPQGKPTKPTFDREEDVPEQTAASWYEWPFFSWVVPLLDRGTERVDDDVPLRKEDLMKLPAHEAPGYNYHRLRHLWSEELQKQDEDPNYKPSITSIIWQVYRHRILTGTALRFLSDGCAFAIPFMLREYTKWLTDPNADVGVGWGWLAGIVLTNMLMAASLQACMQHTMTAFSAAKNGLRLLIFDALLTYDANHEETGKIISAHTQDTQALLDLSAFVHGLPVGIVMVIGGAIALYFFIGYAGLATFGLMVFMTPLQGKVMAKIFELRGPFIRASAKRANTLSELLGGIRIAKFMNWEGPFLDRINDLRADEVGIYKSMQYWRIPVTLLMMALPVLINFFAFSMQYVIEGRIELATAFAALTMLNALRIPIMMIPMSASKYLDCKIAMDRIGEVCSYRGRYVYAKKLDPESKEAMDHPDAAIIMENISVLGDKKKKKEEKNKKDSKQQQQQEKKNENEQGTEMKQIDDGPKQQVIAQNLTVTIPRGKLCMVLGNTAQGKSILIKTLIGESEVQKNQGSLEIFSSKPLAYVPQEAWIMNATIRDNIVMQNEFDKERYDRVIEAAQLKEDLEIFNAGDLTEIGANGITASGGQKARFQLAAAAYSPADIVLADDPLSAVDPHVSAALFENIFLGELKGRTRVLVTHQTQLVQQADYVIIMKNNAIDFAGTLDECKSCGKLDSVIESEKQEAERKQAEKEEKEKADKKKKKEDDEAAEAKKNKAECPAQDTIDAPPEKKELLKKPMDELTDEEKRERGRLISQDTGKAGTVTWGTYGWYIELGTWFSFSMVLIFAFIAAGMFVIGNFTLAFWSDKRQVPGFEPWNDETYMAVMGTSAGIGAIFLVIRQLFFVGFLTSIAEGAHGLAMGRIIRAPTSFFDQTPTGRLISRMTKDLMSMDFMVSEQLQFSINQVFLVIGSVTTVCISAPYILALVPFLIVYFWRVYKSYSNTVRGVKRLDSIENGPVTAIVNEAVSGLASIRVYEMADSLYDEHAKRTADSALPFYNTRECQRWLATRSDIIGNIVLFFACLFGVISRYGDQSSWLPLQPSLIVLAITSTIQATNAVTMLTRTLAELSTEMASTERVREFAEELPQETEYIYNKDGNEGPPPADWPKTTELKFENVSMRYRPNLPLILKDVSVTFESNKRISICGRTGSGKSSTLLTLYRIMELAEGRIILDGRDISHLQLQDLRKHLVMIPQDPLLFSGTVRSNLDPFNQHDDKTILELLERLKMKRRFTDAITDEKEPKGLKAVIKERGSNLSQGERQIMALARAMLKRGDPSKPMIVTLDEATASVDSETDMLIQRTIREHFKNVMTITIAHRLATIIDSDYVLVLDQGKLVEFDKPINLLNKEDKENDKAYFKGMCKKLGPQQYDTLYKIANGEETYAEAIGMDTEIE